jgi:hypothetical protein
MQASWEEYRKFERASGQDEAEAGEGGSRHDAKPAFAPDVIERLRKTIKPVRDRLPFGRTTPAVDGGFPASCRRWRPRPCRKDRRSEQTPVSGSRHDQGPRKCPSTSSAVASSGRLQRCRCGQRLSLRKAKRL